MSLPIVLITEELSPAGIAVLESAFDDQVTPTVRTAEQLLAALADADAVIIRSATIIDAEALEHAPKFRVVARAGVGLDNVDVEAATRAGVMVVNAPTSNIVSAAEHAVALLLAVARNVPQADGLAEGAGSGSAPRTPASSYRTRWPGILGLGKIGVLVAQRLAAFGMTGDRV
jgi:D-3-phosphoglycerate dehydrogenase